MTPNALWQLTTYLTPDGAERTGAVVEDGTLRALPHGVDTGLGLAPSLLQWRGLPSALQEWQPAEQADPVSGRVVAPLRYPRKLVCVGVNYYSHVAEMAPTIDGSHGDPRERLGQRWKPFFFLKTPSTTIIGPGEQIPIDDRDDVHVDWEGELAVVIGTGGRDIPIDKALERVAGYTLLNDISYRSAFRREGPETTRWDWVAHKSVDGSAPLGPGVTPAFLVDDPQRLRLTLSVNGVVKQDASTADMVFSVAEQIAAISAVMTLEPGDVVATGTPPGVGHPRGEYLHPGDDVVVEATGLGQLRNTVVAR